MALLEKPDLLLLDEPTNHLDAETVQWLEAALRDYPGTVIIVTHDRYFLDNITKWILELDKARGLPFEGNYSSWLQQKLQILRASEKNPSPRQKTFARELEWINTSAAARNQANQARINAYGQWAAASEDERRSDMTIQIPTGQRLGDKVLLFKEVCKSYGPDPLIDRCSFDLPRNAIVGVIGPNGIGKTTLFRLITGQEKPDSGSIDMGDRSRSAMSISIATPSTATRPSSRKSPTARIRSRSAASPSPRDPTSPSSTSAAPSSKKKSPTAPAANATASIWPSMLRRGGNLLLLDEPTNDLDVDTMRVLEQAIIDFQGCAMVISHDRFFLDRICTHLLIFEGSRQDPVVPGQLRRLRGKGPGRKPRTPRPPPRQIQKTQAVIPTVPLSWLSRRVGAGFKPALYHSRESAESSTFLWLFCRQGGLLVAALLPSKSHPRSSDIRIFPDAVFRSKIFAKIDSLILDTVLTMSG